MGSLQDALLKSGLADEEKLKKARKSKPSSRSSKHKSYGSKSKPRHQSKPSAGTARRKPAGQHASSKPQKSDLERAWIARQKAEKAEKERAKLARVADQEARRQRNLKLDAIVKDRVLNTDDAEIPRYFEHLGRIRRVLCTPEQRESLNQGSLGLVNLRGRYLIVEPAVLEEYKKLADDLVPDLTGAEPEDQSESDDYPPVPDDITW